MDILLFFCAYTRSMITRAPRYRAASVGLAFVMGTIVFALVFAFVNPRLRPHEPLTPPAQRHAGILELSHLPHSAADPPKTWRLQDHAGKIVLVNYFATWCPPCKAELPDLLSLARQDAPRDVVFVAVSLDTPDDRSPPRPIEPLLRQFAQDHALPFPILLPASNTTLLLDRPAIPQTFLYDRQGRRARAIMGQFDSRDIAQSLEELLKEPSGL
jgi:thiol-disulfide isomerase/thioredoxin